MILPLGHEDMTDEELVAALVKEEIYDQETAEAIVQLQRHPESGDGPLQ